MVTYINTRPSICGMRTCASISFMGLFMRIQQFRLEAVHIQTDPSLAHSVTVQAFKSKAHPGKSAVVLLRRYGQKKVNQEGVFESTTTRCRD